MKKRKIDQDWRITVDHVHREAMRTITDIRNGSVNLDDLDKLQNHLLFSISLMRIEGPKKWALAKLNSEIMSFNAEKIKDTQEG